MKIQNISTYNFRNLSNQNTELYSGVNFIIGKNGQGKTNFIEAVSILSRGKSFRSNKVRELINNSQKEGSVFAGVSDKGFGFNLGIALKSKEKEYYFNNDKLSSLKEFIGRFLCITFSPDDLSLIKGGPLERRNFIDKHILDVKPSYIEAIFSYQRALKNKSSLIKHNHSVKAEQLEPWNLILAESGLKIMRERLNMLQLLQPGILEYYRIFAGTGSEVKINIKNSNLDYKNINFDSLVQAYRENADKEILNKSCLTGVHKDEIEINLDGKNSRFFASQGESRSLVLAMKISVLDQIENSRKIIPVLILDDVDSELDISRRQALADIIFSKERQIIISGTELPEFEQKKSSDYFVFEVSNGSVEKR